MWMTWITFRFSGAAKLLLAEVLLMVKVVLEIYSLPYHAYY